MVGTVDGKEPLGGCGRRLEDNIKIGPKGIGRVGVDWINVTQGRGKWW